MTTKYDVMQEETKANIEEQKQQKKFMFQFISHSDGKRSEPFVGNWDTIREILNLRKEGEAPYDQDFVLLVAVLDGKETIIPSTAIITVKTYLEYFEQETEEQQ